jgi:valyl-tRNA synthetase
VDEQAGKRGDVIMALITEVRREKAEKRMPLNSQVKKLTVYAGDRETAEIVEEGGEDIAGTCKVARLEVVAEKGSGREIAQFANVSFVTEY